MLIEVGILLAAYSGKRLFEKLSHKPTVEIKPDKPSAPSVDNADKKSLVHDKNDKQLEHRLKVSYFSMFVSTIRQFFYSSPLVVLLNLSFYMYNFGPYMKETEKTLLEDKKINAQIVDTILIIAAIATSQYLVVSFFEMIYYLSGKIKAKTQDKSKDMLINVFDQQPRNIWILKDNVEVEIPLETVNINDIVVINTGEVVPVDGIIIEGIATIDQHALTGESQPVEKIVGEQVFAATTIITGQIHVQIEKAGIDTAIAQIGKILNHTTDFKNTTQLKAEQWADKSALPQLGFSSLALLTIGPIGAISALNTNFGYRIKLSGPLGTINYLNLASYHNILIKDGRSLESLTKVDTVLFDKTGTLTQEQPEIKTIIICGKYKADDILAYAAAAERKLAHPIAKAIVQKASESNLSLPDIADSNYKIGYGITVTINNMVIKVGSIRFMTMEGMTIPETIKIDNSQGNSVIMIAINNQIEGAIEIQPTLRSEIKDIISGLRQRGIKYIAIVSGDHKYPTQKLAEKLGMDDYFYDILPEDKAKIVEKFQQEGKFVCFIGDGVNDAIAIKKANVSISLRGATSVATDLAQVVFMDGNLSHLCKLFDIANDLDNQLQKSFVISLIPLPINFIGIFFFHFGILATIIINQTSFWIGIGDAILPLKKNYKNPG